MAVATKKKATKKKTAAPTPPPTGGPGLPPHPVIRFQDIMEIAVVRLALIHNDQEITRAVDWGQVGRMLGPGFRPGSASLPLLARWNNRLYVVDGAALVATLRQQGYREWPCQIGIGLDRAAAHQAACDRNGTGRRNLTPEEEFHHRRQTTQGVREREVHETVTAAGFRIRRYAGERGRDMFPHVKPLLEIYDYYGGVVGLRRFLAEFTASCVYPDTRWMLPRATEHAFMIGLAMRLGSHDEMPALGNRLREVTIAAVLREAINRKTAEVGFVRLSIAPFVHRVLDHLASCDDDSWIRTNVSAVYHVEESEG